jgi:hypothetical protein
VKGDSQNYTDQLNAFVAESGIVLEFDQSIAPAHGISCGGRIQLLPGMEPAAEFSVLVHELSHEMLHRGERRAETSKTIRETEAEAVAFVVSNSIGLDTKTASADYIALYDGDKDTLADSLSFIQSTVTAILREISREDPLQ